MFHPISFESFQSFAIGKGYNNAESYSRTGYLVYAKNGIRVEFQNTRGGVFGVGYRNRKDQVEAVFTALKNKAPAGLTFINRITGSFNYRATNLDDFFALVEAVGAIDLPVAIRSLNKDTATTPAAKTVKLIPVAPKLPAGRSIVGEKTVEEINDIAAKAVARLERKKG